jgi:ketosteroid isomerase-like protein
MPNPPDPAAPRTPPAPKDPAANQALVESFYAAFARRDWGAMAACYHPEAAFRDEVFDLSGKRIGAMWRMLLETGKDLRVEAGGFSAEGDDARAEWVAWYSFSATGRKVRNKVRARFRFKDGLIHRHRDSFGFWRWAAQALGPAGLFLGWMPRLQQKVQARARANLDKFVQAHPEYGP